MKEEARERIIVALDRSTVDENLGLITSLRGRCAWFKVGLRSHYEAGDRVIDAVRAAGGRLFLDLKLHDIPATVNGAVRALARHAPDLLTVHASGGAAMVRAAVEAAREVTPSTRVIAVTVLTSFSAESLEALGLGDVGGTATRWGAEAMRGGADGLVCSGEEVASLRSAHPDATLVVPGIRRAGESRGDQSRVLGPVEAVARGATFLVVGRPIHASEDPAAAWDAYAAEWHAR